MLPLNIGSNLIQERFPAFLELVKKDGYSGPFVPYVGPRYMASEVKVVYCGVAAYYEGAAPFDDLVVSTEWSRSLVEEADIGSPFWRLIDELLGLLYAEEEPVQRRQRITWTNLSKLNWGGRVTSPRDSDHVLRRLNVDQFKDEMAKLAPDLLLCVSGSGLLKTAYELFEPLDLDPLIPAVGQTWVRRLPNDGALYWTMHPGYKSAAWKNAVVGDIFNLATRSARQSLALPRS